MSIYRATFRGTLHTVEADFEDPSHLLIFDGHPSVWTVGEMATLVPEPGKRPEEWEAFRHPPQELSRRAMRRNLWEVAFLQRGGNLTPEDRMDVESAIEAMTKAP